MNYGAWACHAIQPVASSRQRRYTWAQKTGSCTGFDCLSTLAKGDTRMNWLWTHVIDREVVLLATMAYITLC
ncbi:MAG: hypothetical protein GQ565_03080 [Candidatus Aegiribacteria sp.]|nr:hypothetical protein [Candidatus Aegiribacteria sp.]